MSFVVGTDRVMPGWSDGVIGMKPGGKRLLLLPPARGYGARGVQDVIPPDAGLLRRRAEKAFRDAKLTQIYEGTNQINLRSIAQESWRRGADLV